MLEGIFASGLVLRLQRSRALPTRLIGQRAGMAQRADFFVLTWVLVGQAAPSLLLALFLYARKESGTSGGSFFAVLPGTHGMRPDLHAACAPG